MSEVQETGLKVTRGRLRPWVPGWALEIFITHHLLSRALVMFNVQDPE